MSVSVKGTIEAPIESVWTLVGDFAALKRWHPAVVRCETLGEGVGARRIVYFSDWSAEEMLEHSDSVQKSFTYRVIGGTKPDIIGLGSTISLRATSDNRTEIEWRTELPQNSPGAAAMEAHLRSYYPTRIGHIREALAVGDGRTTA